MSGAQSGAAGLASRHSESGFVRAVAGEFCSDLSIAHVPSTVSQEKRRTIRRELWGSQARDQGPGPASFCSASPRQAPTLCPILC